MARVLRLLAGRVKAEQIGYEALLSALPVKREDWKLSQVWKWLVSRMGFKGAPMAELQQVLPAQFRAQVKRLLDELRTEGRIHTQGERRRSKWLIGADDQSKPFAFEP